MFAFLLAFAFVKLKVKGERYGLQILKTVWPVQSKLVPLGLVHTSDGSRVVNGVGIGRKFWCSVNRHDGSDGSRSGIGRKRNSSDPSDSGRFRRASDSGFWFTLDRNGPCTSDSDSASDSVASVKQPLWLIHCLFGVFLSYLYANFRRGQNKSKCHDWVIIMVQIVQYYIAE